ncbi:hypothetical protein [Bacillus cereus group sp. MYBK81-2]|uniref:hypothetical protein n=1 Tax=Bacillus cereus group sp. MYBK81-2 TaxID=3450604 RepID=UPI00061CD9FB|nr:Uncharacterised protein [Streptococcus pneumoniae]CKF44034.1 Uncharacterised protein [Streptococcus pneumoniae]
MNKTAIKNFAVSARTNLMDAVKQKAYELGITETEIKEPETYEDGFRINNKFFKSYELEQRRKLIQKIEEKDYKQVIEEVSYTWFNRFIAIRFMEVNEYLPTGVRVLSSTQEGKNEPDVIGEVTNIADELDLNLDIVYRLQDENKAEDLFKYILIKQCNKLGEIMPMMFETIQDYTELLLPDNLLWEGSVVRNLVSMIEEEDWKEQVEIIGWLYQYYISEKKDEVFAGGEFDESKYKTFKADTDNIIPITDDEYFEDDIVSRFIEFVRVTFSEETLEENLDFIAEALNKKANETSRQCIRRYFLKDFFKDHMKTYQKRPIYWLFDSGKNDGFKALVYMHRYNVGTVAEVRTEYLHTLQRKYEAEIARRDVLLESDASTKDKTRAKKEKEKLQKQLLECQQYDQVIAHIANQKITIDLDDGVKVNYAKFQNVELPQGEGKKPLKANLLAKI